MVRRNNSLITVEEKTAASELSVWVVWWELPDKSWEALCLSKDEAEAEIRLKKEDHVILTWGKAGREEQQSLLHWFEKHIRTCHPADISNYQDPFREVLRRAAHHEPGPVIIRTW